MTVIDNFLDSLPLGNRFPVAVTVWEQRKGTMNKWRDRAKRYKAPGDTYWIYKFQKRKDEFKAQDIKYIDQNNELNLYSPKPGYYFPVNDIVAVDAGDGSVNLKLHVVSDTMAQFHMLKSKEIIERTQENSKLDRWIPIAALAMLILITGVANMIAFKGMENSMELLSSTALQQSAASASLAEALKLAYGVATAVPV